MCVGVYIFLLIARNSLSTTLHSHTDMIVWRPVVAQQHTRRMRNLHNEQSLKMLPHVPRLRFQRKIKLKACEPRPTANAQNWPNYFPAIQVGVATILFFLFRPGASVTWGEVCYLRRTDFRFGCLKAITSSGCLELVFKIPKTSRTDTAVSADSKVNNLIKNCSYLYLLYTQIRAANQPGNILKYRNQI